MFSYCFNPQPVFLMQRLNAGDFLPAGLNFLSVGDTVSPPTHNLKR
ncbi:MAG: hypothetical protein ACLTOK_16775 [Anaerobutyricum soehngenii]